MNNSDDQNTSDGSSAADDRVGSDALLAISVGDKVRCHAPDGWGGHQGDLLDRIAYSGAGLTDGMPTHGMLYCVRGIDYSYDQFAIYLVGIKGTRRPDGTEWSFSAKGFRRVHG